MTAILRLQLDDKDPVRVNSAINQLAEVIDRGGGGGGARTFLTANTIFYVSTTGSDTNSGTSVGSPFLTIQHAYNVITNTLDLGGQNVTIQCASGTYTAGLTAASPWTGGGQVILDLGAGTISTTGDCIDIQASIPGNFIIQNGSLTSAGNCIYHSGSGPVLVGTGMTFGAAGNTHLAVGGAGSTINASNNYTVTGGALYHYLSFKAGNTVEGAGATITLTGTPVFSNTFAYASRLGCIDIFGATFSGATTGRRYIVELNAVIYTGGGGVNYFPGTLPGTPTTGGQYA